MKIPKDQPFWTSVILHLMVLLALFLVTIVQAFKSKEKPHVFEMVEPPNELSQSQQVAPLPPVYQAAAKLPPVPKVNTPKPLVPTPRPAEKPPKPQIIDYQDFTKQHLKDKPKRSPVAPPRDIDVHQIYVPDLSPSRPSPQVSRQQMSALADYSSRLRSRIDAAWVKPAQLVGLRLDAKVVFDVLPSGQMTNVQLRPDSGNKAFDQSILAAFQNAYSAGPTPTGQLHQFTFKFESNL